MTITFPALALRGLNTHPTTELLDDHRALEPPDPIPNSAVKRCIADGSVGTPHVRVGHRQASNKKPRQLAGFFFGPKSSSCRSPFALNLLPSFYSNLRDRLCEYVRCFVRVLVSHRCWKCWI